jgi:hypothetical protein
LIASGPLIAALLASAFHIAIGEELGAFGAIVLQSLFFIKIASVQELNEDILDHLIMSREVRLGEQIEPDAEVLDRLRIDEVITSCDVLRRHALLLGLDRDRGPMLVRP